MIETQINQLSNMIKDMQKQSTLYNPTTFWIYAFNILVDEYNVPICQDQFQIFFLFQLSMLLPVTLL